MVYYFEPCQDFAQGSISVFNHRIVFTDAFGIKSIVASIAYKTTNVVFIQLYNNSITPYLFAAVQYRVKHLTSGSK